MLDIAGDNEALAGGSLESTSGMLEDESASHYINHLFMRMAVEAPTQPLVIVCRTSIKLLL